MTASELDIEKPAFDIVAGDSVHFMVRDRSRSGYFVRWLGRRSGHPLACVVQMADGSERRLNAGELIPSNDARNQRRRVEQGFPAVVADPLLKVRRELAAQRTRDRGCR